MVALGWNVIASYKPLGTTLTFFRVPPVQSQKPIQWWSVPPFPFVIADISTYLPDNILVVAEHRIT